MNGLFSWSRTGIARYHWNHKTFEWVQTNVSTVTPRVVSGNRASFGPVTAASSAKIRWIYASGDFFEAETRLNKISVFSPYLKENTTLHHYKDQLVNAV
jgi:hypothetical protein